MTDVLIKGGKLAIVMYKGEDTWKHDEKMAVYKPGREVSEETNPTDTLIWDFEPPE